MGVYHAEPGIAQCLLDLARSSLSLQGTPLPGAHGRKDHFVGTIIDLGAHSLPGTHLQPKNDGFRMFKMLEAKKDSCFTMKHAVVTGNPEQNEDLIIQQTDVYTLSTFGMLIYQLVFK